MATRTSTSTKKETVDAITESLVTSIPGLTRVGDLHLERSTSRCRLTGSAHLAGKPITWRSSGRDLAGTVDELRRHLRRMAAAFRSDQSERPSG
jgi:hypothetical protein